MNAQIPKSAQIMSDASRAVQGRTADGRFNGRFFRLFRERVFIAGIRHEAPVQAIGDIRNELVGELAAKPAKRNSLLLVRLGAGITAAFFAGMGAIVIRHEIPRVDALVQKCDLEIFKPLADFINNLLGRVFGHGSISNEEAGALAVIFTGTVFLLQGPLKVLGRLNARVKRERIERIDGFVSDIMGECRKAGLNLPLEDREPALTKVQMKARRVVEGNLIGNGITGVRKAVEGHYEMKENGCEWDIRIAGTAAMLALAMSQAAHINAGAITPLAALAMGIGAFAALMPARLLNGKVREEKTEALRQVGEIETKMIKGEI